MAEPVDSPEMLQKSLVVGEGQGRQMAGSEDPTRR